MKGSPAMVLGMFLTASAAADEFSAAQRLGTPNTKVMGCPEGAFWDPRNGGECWSCGHGTRTANPVDGPRACLVPPRTSFEPAVRLESNKSHCDGDSFLDVGTGACWSCPSGTRRTLLPVTGEKACSKRIAKQERKATFVYEVGSLLKPCRKGTFANVGSRSCYSCPGGWKHDPAKRVQTDGVCYKPATTDHLAATRAKTFSLSCKDGFYDPIDGGSCWECPDQHVRQISSVKSAQACMRVTRPQSVAATKVKDHSPGLKQVAAGVSRLGCRAHGNDAFFDLIDGGSCWSCPSSHPQRTIYPVDTGRACATKTCGTENGRPCYVWERIPSCNEGLMEDPIKGQCVRPKDLACNAYIKTLAAIRDVVTEAQTRGSQAAEESMKKIPGAKAFVSFALNQVNHAQETMEKARPKVNYEGIVEPYTGFLQANSKFVENYLRTVTIVAEQREAFTDLMLDADLMCGGDLNRLTRRLADAGLHDAFRSVEPDPTRIKMGQLGAIGLPVAMAMSGTLPATLARVTPVVGPGSRNRLILDFSMDLSADLFGVKGFKGVFSPGLQVAIALDSLANGDHGVYWVFGGYAGGAEETPKDLQGLIKDNLGAVHFSVGVQLGGPERYADDPCHDSGIVSSGVVIKTKYMGFGFNPTCPLAATFSGFNVNVGAMNLGELKTFAESITQVATGSGAVAGAQAPWTQRRFERAYPTRELLGGGEVTIRLLPFGKDYRRGAAF